MLAVPMDLRSMTCLLKLLPLRQLVVRVLPGVQAILTSPDGKTIWMYEWINLYYTELCTCNTIYLWTYEYVYTITYTWPIKAYNSVLNKTIHLFKVKDRLYHNIHISTSYIKTFPKEFGSGFNILPWHQYSELKVIITLIKIRI